MFIARLAFHTAPFGLSLARLQALVQAMLVGGECALSVAEIAALGVRRISVGGGMARTAWGGFQRAARGLLEQGRFDGFAGAASGAELNALFAGRHGA